MPSPRIATFSIVAADLDRKQWGVAVQSRFIAVGADVPWAEAGAGAIATQALANVAYGPTGLARLRTGASAEEVVQALTSADDQRAHRQLGVVDAKGRAASYTGSECLPWAGHRVGDGYCCQGNILFSEAVVRAMARTFESTRGDLPDRLLAALAAGQREGGDRRGMQAAALLVVMPNGGYGGATDRWVDVRVDDHPSPIEELRRVFKLYDMTLLSREDPATLLPLDGPTVQRIQRALGTLGYRTGPVSGTFDKGTESAFTTFVNENNFENKMRTDGKLWPSILDYLETRARQESERRRTTTAPVTGALSRGPGAAGGTPSPTRRSPE